MVYLNVRIGKMCSSNLTNEKNLLDFPPIILHIQSVGKRDL